MRPSSDGEGRQARARCPWRKRRAARAARFPFTHDIFTAGARAWPPARDGEELRPAGAGWPAAAPATGKASRTNRWRHVLADAEAAAVAPALPGDRLHPRRAAPARPRRADEAPPRRAGAHRAAGPRDLPLPLPLRAAARRDRRAVAAGRPARARPRDRAPARQHRRARAGEPAESPRNEAAAAPLPSLRPRGAGRKAAAPAPGAPTVSAFERLPPAGHGDALRAPRASSPTTTRFAVGSSSAEAVPPP